MSTSSLLPRLSCSCTGPFLAGRAGGPARAFSTLPARRAARSTQHAGWDSWSESSLWKGKGKATEFNEGGYARRARSTGSIQLGRSSFPAMSAHNTINPISGSIRHNSTKSDSTRYAHESLLSLPDKAAPESRPNRLGFFSRSANPSKPIKPTNPVTDGLPPPSTSPLVPVHSPLPAALPPTKLSDGMPNPAIRWREDVQNSIADDLTIYKQISKVSRRVYPHVDTECVLTDMLDRSFGCRRSPS